MRKAVGLFALFVMISLIPLVDSGESTEPMVTIIEPVNGSFFPPGNITINWTARFNGKELDHYELMINNGSWKDLGENNTVNISNAIPGQNKVTVRAYDNESAYGEANVTFFIDDIPPEIETISPVNGSLLNTGFVNVTWSLIEEGSGMHMVRVKVDEGPWSIIYDADFKNITPISDGARTITVEATDMVGNMALTSFEITVDTILPSILDVRPIGSDVERDERIFVDIGEEIDLSSLEFEIDPPTNGTFNNSGYQVEFIPDLPLIPGTEYTVNVNFSDHAGNSIGPYEWKFRVASYYLEGVVNGYVVDSYGEYVLGAMVKIGNITVITDIFGRFDVEIMPGTHNVRIEKEGYDTYTGNITLLPNQEVDLGKLILEGGSSPPKEEEDEIPWILIVIIVLIVGGITIGIITKTGEKGTEFKGAEE
jgi:uncharacterized membrane protein